MRGSLTTRPPAHELDCIRRPNLVAEIAVDGEGPRLAYDPDWRGSAGAFPISLSMPLANFGAPPEIVVPWLMNLLPEGDPLRAMTRALGVARDDILGLIAETGREPPRVCRRPDGLSHAAIADGVSTA